MTQSYTVTKASSQQDSDKGPGVRLLSSNSKSDNMVLGETIEKSIVQVKPAGKNDEKIQMDKEERCKKFQHWTKILWTFATFAISILDVLVIIYLSYLHFHHSSDIIAWLMLLPILLNFIGIFTFLSDDDERREMESLGCQTVFWKNAMFFPILGPSVSSLKLFVLSFREHESDRFERLESLLTRMKQYESYFRAAPEAFVQLTFRIITWSRVRVFHEEDYWTNLCLSLCLFSLAEAHMYSTVVPYYRMFHREKSPDAWKIEHINIPMRAVLFFFTYLSVESRLYADAILKATSCFYFSNYSFGEVLIVTFLLQFVVRAALYSFFVGCLGSRKQRYELRERGVYGAFTYSWRSLFMSFDFTSCSPRVFLSFYLENAILIVGSYTIIYTLTDVDLGDKYVFHVYAVIAMVSMFIAILLRFVIKFKLQLKFLPNKNKVDAQD